MMLPVGKMEPRIPFDVYIVAKVTDDVPQTTLTRTTWPHMETLELADPTFQTPGPVDIILGADIAPAILTGTKIEGKFFHPSAFGTLFGWILMGPAAPTRNHVIINYC